MSNLKWLKVLVLFIIVFALQMTVADWLSFFDVGPDFVIIFIVAIAIRMGPAAGCFWGFVAGFTQDVYAPVVGVLGLGFFVCDMIYFLVTGLGKDVVTNLFLTKTLPECLYTMLIGGIFFYLDIGKKKKKHA